MLAVVMEMFVYLKAAVPWCLAFDWDMLLGAGGVGALAAVVRLVVLVAAFVVLGRLLLVLGLEAGLMLGGALGVG